MELFTEHRHTTTAITISFSKEIIQESAKWMEIGLERSQNVNQSIIHALLVKWVENQL